jgi:hypothetical protein
MNRNTSCRKETKRQRKSLRKQDRRKKEPKKAYPLAEVTDAYVLHIKLRTV